jgi:guanylate kinase
VPRLFVISGPSGAGKGTLIRGVLEAQPDLAAVAISATTRTRRPGEVDGREYHFFTDAEFSRFVAEGAFVEHVEFAGNRYGTLVSEINRLLDSGRNVVLELEVEGSLVIKEQRTEACLIFIDCDPDELERRLIARQTELAGEIQERLQIAREQSQQKDRFDYVIRNDDVDTAVAELLETMEREARV